jgi:hypothetical protein
VDVKWLPTTNGEWKAETIDADLKGATGGFFELHNNNSGADAGIRLRKFVVTDPAGPTAAATPPTPKANAVPVKADFAAFGVGTYTLGAGAVNPADGWSADQFTPGDKGELIVTSENGGKVVTLTNGSGEGTCQLYQSKPAGTLAAGGSYLLKFEYKTATTTTGLLEVRERDVSNLKDCPHSYKLDSTGDKWELRTFEIEAAADYPAVFVVQNRDGTAGNRLSVRKLELVPVGGNQNAPTPPADDRVAYSLDLTGQKAFAVRRKFRDITDLSRTGDGTPPAGWRSHSWEATCEHELFADTIDGSPALGLRFVGGKATGMMAVDGITVKPNSTYELKFEYRTSGEYNGDNGVRYRSTGNGGKLILGGKLEKTDGKWVEKVVAIKTDASGTLQLEFHHLGPAGAANSFLLRKCQVVRVP